MRVALFYHSALSDWNHGNAHFLRGVATELILRGHEVDLYEPRDAWSYLNLVEQHGQAPLAACARAYPALEPIRYDREAFALEEALRGTDLVLVHEWNDPQLVARIGRLRAEGARFRLLFHDTHHRAVTERAAMAAYDLSGFDGVLAFGRVLSELYLRERWCQRAFVWHEAADTRVFHPRPPSSIDRLDGDLVWIGNFGDDERTAELRQYLLGPVRALGLRATVHGVRYPEAAQAELAAAGIRYAGWLPNFEVPSVFTRHRVTVHIPRGPYARALPGIPTIRVFEALACGIPLVSAPWDDAEGLFEPGRDFLIARDGVEMQAQLRSLLAEPERARELAAHGLATLRARHTCAHRVDELCAIAAELGVATAAPVQREVA